MLFNKFLSSIFSTALYLAPLIIGWYGVELTYLLNNLGLKMKWKSENYFGKYFYYIVGLQRIFSIDFSTRILFMLIWP